MSTTTSTASTTTSTTTTTATTFVRILQQLNLFWSETIFWNNYLMPWQFFDKIYYSNSSRKRRQTNSSTRGSFTWGGGEGKNVNLSVAWRNFGVSEDSFFGGMGTIWLTRKIIISELICSSAATLFEIPGLKLSPSRQSEIKKSHFSTLRVSESIKNDYQRRALFGN